MRKNLKTDGVPKASKLGRNPEYPITTPARSIAYENDPEFRRYPKTAASTGPGSKLAPQQREIVRRLEIAWRLQPSMSYEALLFRLPRGVELNEDQRHLLISLRPQARKNLQKSIRSLWALDYVRQPPKIEQFIDDDYYLGASLRRTVDNEGLWPEWREWLKENANLESFLHELVITGAIGTGKTLVMVTLLLYRICICAHLRDPYAFFGLNRGSPIVFLMLSLSMDTLRATAWLTGVRFMRLSPFFREFCGFEPNRINSETEVLLRPANSKGAEITLSGGSKIHHQIGRNVLGVSLDEGNFRLEQHPQEYASQLFGDLRTRMVSRYQRVGNFIPGLSVVASSAADESCFTEKLRDEIEKKGDHNAQVVVRKAIYRVKPGLQLSSWWFKVAFGIPNVEPAILRGCYGDSGQPIPPPRDCPEELAGTHEAAHTGARVELVPGVYYDSFARSPWKALQQLSGISLGAANRLFPTLADIERCLEISIQEKVPVPTSASVISVSDEDSRMIWDNLDHAAFVQSAGSGRYEPVRHPLRLRYVHLDLAITGFAGLGICHLADPPTVEPTKDGAEGQPLRLIVEYDFILTLKGGRTRPICYEKILKFLFWLQNPCGFRFGLVTADSFQSEHMLQTLEARGVKTANLSVDRDKRAYLAWQGGFQEHNIRLYRQSRLLKEAEELIELETKIDHPPNGTKDTTDAAAGAFLNAISSEEVHDLTVPHAPSVMLGVSPFANASPEDPFGFFIRIPPRPIRVFQG